MVGLVDYQRFPFRKLAHPGSMDSSLLEFISLEAARELLLNSRLCPFDIVREESVVNTEFDFHMRDGRISVTIVPVLWANP
jgi:hypothetical protein